MTPLDALVDGAVGAEPWLAALGDSADRWRSHAHPDSGLTWAALDCAHHGHPCGIHIHADGGQVLWIAHGPAYGHLEGDCMGHVLNVDHPEIADLRGSKPRGRRTKPPAVPWSIACEDCADTLGWLQPCELDLCGRVDLHNDGDGPITRANRVDSFPRLAQHDLRQHVAALGAHRGLVDPGQAARLSNLDENHLRSVVERIGLAHQPPAGHVLIPR